jgi:hypothetical protein
MFAEAQQSHRQASRRRTQSLGNYRKFPVVCVWGSPAADDGLLEVNQQMMCSGKLNLFRDFLIHSDNEH